MQLMGLFIGCAFIFDMSNTCSTFVGMDRLDYRPLQHHASSNITCIYTLVVRKHTRENAPWFTARPTLLHGGQWCVEVNGHGLKTVKRTSVLVFRLHLKAPKMANSRYSLREICRPNIYKMRYMCAEHCSKSRTSICGAWGDIDL